MPRNGAGSYSLPESPFVPNTPISSSAVNSDLSDIATAITGSIAADGQTAITGALKGANGTAAAPSYGFNSDPNTGMYRIGADNLGFSVGGTKIVDIASTGVTITGALTPTGTFVAPDGTVLLPSYTFANDLDCGLYRIGANNIGFSVNAAKILDIGTTGLNVIGVIQANGTPLAPAAFASGMINGVISESRAGNATTYALKTLAGTDASATDPIYAIFRNATAATGNYVVRTITAALSVTIPSTATMGASNGVPFRIWNTLFDDGGTMRLGVINCLSGANIYPLGQMPLASSTTIGAGADSAHVFYTDAGVTAKSYLILGYSSYESGLATAGLWDVAPTRIQLFGPGVPLPGTVIQIQQTRPGTVATGSTVIPFDDSIPQIGEGDQYLSQAITPTSACNLRNTEAMFLGAVNGNTQISVALFLTGTNNALAVAWVTEPSAGYGQNIFVDHAAIFGSSSAQTLSMRAGPDVAATITFNGTATAQRFGGAAGSYLRVTEVMA